MLFCLRFCYVKAKAWQLKRNSLFPLEASFIADVYDARKIDQNVIWKKEHGKSNKVVHDAINVVLAYPLNEFSNNPVECIHNQSLHSFEVLSK